MIITVAVVLTKGKQRIRLRMKDVPVKRHDSREEISADVAGIQVTKGTVAAPIMGQSDTLCSTQALSEEPYSLALCCIVIRKRYTVK